MTLASVAADDPVEASLTNQLVANVNSSPSAIIFTSSGTWSVPSGVHKFKVTLCGGGGRAGLTGSGGAGIDAYPTPGGPGGDSIARSIWVSGADIGTSYPITIGAGSSNSSAGGSTSFGTLITVTGGGPGGSESTLAHIISSKGSPGVVSSGTLSGSAVAVGNKSVAIYDAPGNYPRGYGEGGPFTPADSASPVSGAPGIVIIEW